MLFAQEISGFQEFHLYAAAFIARAVLGILFFFQGYDAIFRIGIRNVIETYEDTYRSKGIPTALTAAGIWFTAVVQLIAGFFLIIGMGTSLSLMLLGLALIVAALAFSIASPMWDMKHHLPRLLLLIFLLIIPVEWNVLSIDYLILDVK